MKTYNRKIYILPNLNDDLKNRLAHIDNGIANDELIPQGVSFNVSYNRDVVKKINRFSDFLSKSDPNEIEKYFNEREEIKNLNNIYSNLKSYTPNDSYFTLIFYESKGIIRENEYKFLYLLPKNKEFNLMKNMLEKYIRNYLEKNI